MRMKKSMVGFTAVVISAVVFSAVVVQESLSIPYFAKKYDAECSMCHWHQPKLNSFGKRFQKNGFRMTKNETPDAIKSVEQFPVSVKIEPRMVFGNNAKASSDFQLHAIELQMGASLPGGGSIFIEKYLEERGDYHNAGDAFINWPLGESGYVKFGQFATMNHIPDSERVTISRNIVYNTRVSAGGAKNRVRLRDRQRGIEFGGTFGGNTTASLSVFNGNADAAETNDIADDNDFKSFNFTVDHSFIRSSLGVFYHGGDNAAAGAQSNRFYRAGITGIYKPSYDWNIELIGMRGLDKNLLADDGSTRLKSNAFSLEVDRLLRDGLVVFARHGEFRTSATGLTTTTARELTAGVSCMLNQTQKLTLEYQKVSGGEDGELQIEAEINF